MNKHNINSNQINKISQEQIKMRTQMLFSSIDKIVGDMKINNQRVRSMFKFEMAQAMKSCLNPESNHNFMNLKSISSVQTEKESSEEVMIQSADNMLSSEDLNKVKNEQEIKASFVDIHLKEQPSKSTLPMSSFPSTQTHPTGRFGFLVEEQFEEDLTEIDKNDSENNCDNAMTSPAQFAKINHSEMMGKSPSFTKNQKTLNNFGTPFSHMLVTCQRTNTNQTHQQIDYTPEEKICQFDGQYEVQ